MKQFLLFLFIIILFVVNSGFSSSSEEKAKIDNSSEVIHSGSQKEETGNWDELGKKLGPAIAQEIWNQNLALGLFCVSSLLIVLFAKKVWGLNIHMWLVLIAGVVVSAIGCVRFVLEYHHLDTYLNPLVLIISLLLWSFILTVFGYGWRRSFLLSLLLSFSYTFWIGVYKCFL